MTRPQDTFIDTSGRSLDISHPDTASGIYFASDAAIAASTLDGTNPCPQGMRPSRVVIKGLEFEGKNYINACNGKISQEDMPDVHIVDWQYRIYIDLVLVLLVLAVSTGIIAKMVRK
jgi:hypothetical protein